MFDDELYVCPKCGASRKPREFCSICQGKDMALKKKPVVVPDFTQDDVAKVKQDMADAAKAVTNAAKGLTVPMTTNPKLDEQWTDIRSQAAALDGQFGDIEVRVMQIGPDGRLTDVSDRVNPRDVQPEQIEGFTSSDGSVNLPRNPRGEVDSDAALDFMGQLLGINRRSRRAGIGTLTESTEAIKAMEVLLADSDKILKKLRR
jgi:hypothetical protein